MNIKLITSRHHLYVQSFEEPKDEIKEFLLLLKNSKNPKKELTPDELIEEFSKLKKCTLKTADEFFSLNLEDELEFYVKETDSDNKEESIYKISQFTDDYLNEIDTKNLPSSA